MDTLYGGMGYARRNPSWHEEDAAAKAEAIAELVRWGGLEPHTVADVGCGTGAVLHALQAELDHEPGLTDTLYEGWDIAPEAIRRARRRESARTTFVGEDFLASERRVDLVLCIDTFEHVPDDVAFLSGLRSHAPWFVFRVPLDLSALDVVRPHRLLGARRRYGHRHLYSRVLALEVLAEAGYVVEAERYHRVPPLLVGPRARLVDAARRLAFRAAPARAVNVLGGWSLLVLARPAPWVATPVGTS